MKILVTGKNGQVGWELARSLLPLGEVVALTRAQCDLSRPETLPGIVQEIKPDVIVNAAAYTAVDKAEEEEALATAINGAAVGVLAEEAKKRNALLVHFSTDYVFDGAKSNHYSEDDTPCPINAYGRSKLAGEQAIRSIGVDNLIFRTSWVYAARGNNFLRTILRLAQARDDLGIVADQTGTPTWARLIAETVCLCIRQTFFERRNGTFDSGIYHLTSSGETSWYGFANAIVDYASRKMDEKMSACDIKPVGSIDYPTPAERPMNSRLAVDELEKHFEVTMPDWKQALSLCMDEIK